MAITGKDGKVTVDATELVEISEFSIDESADVLETTNFDNTSGHRTYIPGLKDSTGSFSGNWSASNMTATAPGTTATGKFNIDGSNYAEGDIIITSRSTSNTVDGICEGSFDFQFADAPEWTTE